MSDKLVPLKVVCFDKPTSIPGTTVMLTTVEAKVRMLPGGQEFVTPQPYLDPETGNIHMEDRVYPSHRVHFYVRAKMALSKEPPPFEHDYTVGKREPRRIIVTVPPPPPKAKA